MNHRLKLPLFSVLAISACIEIIPVYAKDNLDVELARKGSPHDFIYSLSFEGRNGVAVGSHGLLLTTEDAGKNWQKAKTPSELGALLTTSRVSGKCLVAGQEGAILRSDDCKHWESIKPASNARILGVHSNSSGIAIAVGEFGTVLRSTDWGKSWIPQQIDWKSLIGNENEPHLYAVNIAEDGSVMLVGEFELIVRTSPGTPKWELLHKGERSLFGLAVGENGRILAVGQEGLILESNDNGKKWSPIRSHTSAILTDIWTSKDNSSVVVVGARTILVSKDSGRSFSLDQSPVSTQGMHSSINAIEETGKATSIFIGGSTGSIISFKY